MPFVKVISALSFWLLDLDPIRAKDKAQGLFEKRHKNLTKEAIKIKSDFLPLSMQRILSGDLDKEKQKYVRQKKHLNVI